MQQAILITAYKNINHIYKLVKSLPHNFKYYIHIDKKSKISKQDIFDLTETKNVAFVTQSYNVNWGGINHLKSILLLLSEAAKDEKNEYFHLITGHDFPIKTSSEINSFMEENKGKEFMEIVKLPYDKWENGGYDRILYYNMYDLLNARSGWRKSLVRNIIVLQKKLNIKRRFSSDFPRELYGGSTYWSLSRDYINYVLNYIKEKPYILNRFKHTFCSEEFFFQTLIMASPFRDRVINDNLRFIVWEERNGNFPANLDESDFDNILKSRALFARKFEYPVSEKLLTQISDFIAEPQET